MFFFFNDTATTEIYTLSLHDALPIWPRARRQPWRKSRRRGRWGGADLTARGRSHRRAGLAIPIPPAGPGDRKITRLNSSHANISYAVFCLKKKQTYSHFVIR